MKAIIKKDSSPGLEIQEIDKPTPGPLDVIVKIKKSSICGTDIHIYDWDDWSSKTVKPPMQIGHEWTGVVDSVGSEVNKYKQGDRVSGEGHVVCGECRNCKAGKRHLCIDQHGIGVHLPGAFAEFLKIPATNLFSLPDSIPDNIDQCILSQENFNGFEDTDGCPDDISTELIFDQDLEVYLVPNPS